MTAGTSPGLSVPPDWYPDPAGIGQYRYWDGLAWTAGVVVDGRVTERPLPPPGTEHQLRDVLPGLPAGAAWLALGGFVGGVVVSGLLIAVALLADLPAVIQLIAAMVGLWSGLVGACVVVSRRFGTGRIGSDYGLRLCWGDLSWGLLASITARVTGAVIAVPFVLMGLDEVGPRAGLFEGLEVDVLTVLVVAFVAVIGAPIIEELFFRGLLQRALLPKLGTAGAVCTQAFLFALVHLSPTSGMSNVLVVGVIFPAGVVFGLAAKWRGLGTSVVAHSLFNVVAVIASLAAASSGSE